MGNTPARRALVVDDDPELLDLVSGMLKRDGWEVLKADNGRDALQTVLDERLDLVLLDVMLPFIDGYHLASQLTGRRQDGRPRVLIMTARDVEREKGSLLASGADGALRKPFDTAELKAAVEKAFGGPRP